MAWLKTEQSSEVKLLQSQIDMLNGIILDLREDKRQLTIRLDKLQDALVAKESPIAYNDMRLKEMDIANPIISPFQQEQMEEGRFVKKYMEGLEADMFDSPDDLIDTMLKSAGMGFNPTKVVDSEEA